MIASIGGDIVGGRSIIVISGRLTSCFRDLLGLLAAHAAQAETKIRYI